MLRQVAVFCLISLFVPYSTCCTTDQDILIDIIYVVDGSGSIGPDNFELVKLWLINATTILHDKFGSRAQQAVLEYSGKDARYKRIPIEQSTVFEIPFRLGECSDTHCMSSRIRNMKYLQSQTYTYYALRRAIEVEFPYSDRHPNARKAMILLTDGAANDGVYLPRAYEACVRENITNFAIGVGNYLIDQLKIFANGGGLNERVFVRTDFESLSTVIDMLQEELEKEGFFCDECKSGTDNCHVDADCINEANGFSCKCKSGYYGDGVDCKLINYCKPNPCKDENSKCVPQINSYTCDCIQGFKMVGDVCENIDDCAANPCGDGEHTKCIDHVGGYFCTCEDGYVFDGISCTDPPEDPSNFVMILTFILVAVIIMIIAISICCLIKRQNVYIIHTPRGDHDKELIELSPVDRHDSSSSSDSSNSSNNKTTKK